MSLGHFFLVLRARWRAALFALFATLAVVVIACLVLPKRYTATAAVVLDTRLPDPMSGLQLGTSSVSNYMATQVDVVTSERVALRALRSLKLNESKEWHERWMNDTAGEGDFEPWLVDRLGRWLTVKPSRDSNVITISYEAPDRRFAADMANAYMKAFVDTALDLRTEPARQYNSFFDDRARVLRDNLEKAQSKLSAYQQSKGIVATDEKMDVENERLSGLSAQYVALQGLAAETQGRQGQVKNGERLQEVVTNPLVISLQTDLARDEAQLQQMTQRYGAQYPQVVELRATIAELKQRIASATQRVSGSVTLNNNVNQSRLAEIRNELEAQRAKVMKLNGLRDEAQVLLRDVENAKKAYETMMQRVSQSDMESQNTQTNVSVLKNASVPAFPSSPRIVLSIAVALVLGLLLAMATAVIRERLDRRLRTDDEVPLLLSLPMLVRLPVSRHALGAKSSKKALAATTRRMLAGLPARAMR